ncbi:MAG: trehalase-like domain-containing protein, partial [Thermoleophilaceae bacterium]
MAKADYPPIGDYALIGDCHTVALVSSAGSIDWCCLPRVDSGSTFGRILDWERGGCFELAPVRPDSPGLRDYADDTLVLTSGFRGEGGEALVTDCLLGPPGTERTDERRHILRVVEGRRGATEFTARIAPRFDFGQLHPWIRHHGRNTFSATGGDDGLLVWSDAPLEAEDGELRCGFTV